MKIWLPLIAVYVLLAGCSGGSADGVRSAPASKNVMSEMSTASGEALRDGPSAPAVPSLPRKIIYTGSVALRTDDLDAAEKKLDEMVKQFNGYLGSASRSGTKGSQRSGSWTIRIPSTGYGSFVKAISTIGELESSSQEAQDVSEEFYDVQARLKNKKVEEARLVELLQKATGKLTEVLQVEKEISRIREEIEQIEGRLRFLTNQTDLSTITVTINEVKEFRPVGPPSLSTDVKRAFTESVGQLGDVARGILIGVIAILPWAVLPGLVVGFLLIRARSAKAAELRSKDDGDSMRPQI
jgi:hypothetical protein